MFPVNVLGLIFSLVRQDRRLLLNMLWSCLWLLHTVYTAPWRWWDRTVTTGAAALDNWTHTSHPRLTIRGQLEAGAGARPRGARPASSLLTTPPSTALVTLTLATEDLERWGPVTNISQFWVRWNGSKFALQRNQGRMIILLIPPPQVFLFF